MPAVIIDGVDVKRPGAKIVVHLALVSMCIFVLSTAVELIAHINSGVPSTFAFLFAIIGISIVIGIPICSC